MESLATPTDKNVGTFALAAVSVLDMRSSGIRCLVLLTYIASAFVCPTTLFAQSTLFIGNWKPANWNPKGRNRGIALHIERNLGALQGTVYFCDPRSEHEAVMLNPKLSGEAFTFDVRDDYVGTPLSFSMTVETRDKTAAVNVSSGEMFLDFKLVQQPEPSKTCGTGQESVPYPNELPGYRFFQTAKWRNLTPSSSAIVDVRKLLGDPDVATDLAHPVAPYPGDATVTSVVFTYSSLMPGWDVLIYLNESCGVSQKLRLCSVDLLPHKRTPFAKVTFPSKFTKRHIGAADAAWDEYIDDFGLRYEVYTTKTPYGNELPGDLDRISYGKP